MSDTGGPAASGGAQVAADEVGEATVVSIQDKEKDKAKEKEKEKSPPITNYWVGRARSVPMPLSNTHTLQRILSHRTRKDGAALLVGLGCAAASGTVCRGRLDRTFIQGTDGLYRLCPS